MVGSGVVWCGVAPCGGVVASMGRRDNLPFLSNREIQSQTAASPRTCCQLRRARVLSSLGESWQAVLFVMCLYIGRKV